MALVRTTPHSFHVLPSTEAHAGGGGHGLLLLLKSSPEVEWEFPALWGRQAAVIKLYKLQLRDEFQLCHLSPLLEH